MKAKKVYEFEQGGDPYDTMGLGKLQVDTMIESTADLAWKIGWIICPDIITPAIRKYEQFIIVKNDVLLSSMFPNLSGPKGIGYHINPVDKYSSNGPIWISLDDINKYFKRF
jgi:hypothetical protein